GFDLEGKTVAVIGTGASAIQFVPEIAPKVEQLHVFQRTPPWIVPKPDRAVGRRAKLTPAYAIGCKRILISNDWYPTLQRPNVGLVTDGIERITRTGIRTRDGVERPVDAIICGTGFMVADYINSLHIVGRGGHTLNASVQAREGHHLGTTVRGFPNLYVIMGPNTGLGHNSMIFMIEAQARYALQAIQAIRRRKLRFLD